VFNFSTHISTNLKTFIDEGMYNYMHKHSLIDKYFESRSNFMLEGSSQFNKFENVEYCNNTDEIMCDYRDEFNDNAYNFSTNAYYQA
jgi:hypothetical protein